MLSWKSNNLTTCCEELTHLKRPWCWERLRAGGEGDDRGWDGWMASPTQWTWVWVNSGSWWWTGRPGVLWFMGSQRVRHDWADWWDQMPWYKFFECCFKPAFFLSSFTLIKRLFSSFTFSAIRVVSSAYVRLLILLSAIWVPACDSSSPAFHIRYSAWNFSKQGDNTQPCHTSFPILNQSVFRVWFSWLLFDLHICFSANR